MWYAYGLVDTVGDLQKLIHNLSSWTSPNGTCLVPLADPRLITGVDLPYELPFSETSRVVITGIVWSYFEDDVSKAHLHQIAPNREFMVEQFERYFGHVEIISYPAILGQGARPALLASQKRAAGNQVPGRA